MLPTFGRGPKRVLPSIIVLDRTGNQKRLRLHRKIIERLPDMKSKRARTDLPPQKGRRVFWSLT